MQGHAEAGTSAEAIRAPLAAELRLMADWLSLAGVETPGADRFTPALRGALSDG